MKITFTMPGLEEATIGSSFRFSWPGHTVLAQVEEVYRGDEGLVLTVNVPGLELDLPPLSYKVSM